MITKTLTSHDVYNYGASLQAYSLQQFFFENGHENEIIDYKPAYCRGRYNFWYISPKYKFSNCKLLWFPVCLFLAPKRFKTYKRKKSFDTFKAKYLHLTEERYDDYESLNAANLKADAFIVGSDQVWNSDHINGRDPANYLSFVKDGKKLSYAASFGMDHIYPGYEELVRENLKSFDCITVREYQAVAILSKLGIRGEYVVDPTLLHNREWWEKLCIDKTNENYLLVYDFGQSPVVREMAIQIATERKLKIYSINDFTEHNYADVNINDGGPVEFLSLIRGAKFFISNSFHGTIFSIIFQIPFLVVKRRVGDVNSRMESLLDLVGCSDRLVEKIEDLQQVKTIDFNNIQTIVNREAKHSSELLISALSKK